MEADYSGELTDALRRARQEGISVAITGSGSKSFLTRSADPEIESRLLSVVSHAGVVDYRPDELVVTVRCGTPLKELQQILARQDQMLAFEPPQFQGQGTVGGAVACGLAGPGRPWRGSVGDSVLGVVMINGLGQKLTFGGQVMKNVAGYDVSRLQAGAFGTLGVLLDLSLKVIPRPASEATRVLELDAEAALKTMRRLALSPVPITATCYFDGVLRIRLSGAEPAVTAAADGLGGESEDVAFWERLNHHDLPLFRSSHALACRHSKPASAVGDTDQLIEWSGARRWGPAIGNEPVFGEGYASHLCGGEGLFNHYYSRIRTAFDPDMILNTEVGRADVSS